MSSNCVTFDQNVQKARTQAYETARAMCPLRQECKRLKKLLEDREQDNEVSRQKLAEALHEKEQLTPEGQGAGQ